jgi:hypothetical protein
MIRDGERRTVDFSYRMFTFPELRSLLCETGFEEVTGYGELGSEFGLGSTRMIVVARK